jgi:hypothetical protein
MLAFCYYGLTILASSYIFYLQVFSFVEVDILKTNIKKIFYYYFLKFNFEISVTK